MWPNSHHFWCNIASTVLANELSFSTWRVKEAQRPTILVTRVVAPAQEPSPFGIALTGLFVSLGGSFVFPLMTPLWQNHALAWLCSLPCPGHTWCHHLGWHPESFRSPRESRHHLGAAVPPQLCSYGHILSVQVVCATKRVHTPGVELKKPDHTNSQGRIRHHGCAPLHKHISSLQLLHFRLGFKTVFHLASITPSHYQSKSFPCNILHNPSCFCNQITVKWNVEH